jgi:hypothetical protein
MNRWKKFRAWANRDNGSHYQVGNRNLSALENIGYLLCITAFLIYLADDKAGFSATWLGWLLLASGFTLAVIGLMRKLNIDKGIF